MPWQIFFFFLVIVSLAPAIRAKMYSSASGTFLVLMSHAAREKESTAIEGRCHPRHKATMPASHCFLFMSNPALVNEVHSLAGRGRPPLPGSDSQPLTTKAEVNAKVA